MQDVADVHPNNMQVTLCSTGLTWVPLRGGAECQAKAADSFLTF